ncbi:MAG: metallophosphoesterase family protein [Bacteroidales bacterium]|nr:metallophosphoesterase family protein [Candidatus Liminaster caballi]
MRILTIIIVAILAGLIALCCLRWKAWFHNPQEEPYTAASVPSRLLLTFGDEGELSRYVSWTCGDEVDYGANLYIVRDSTADTITIAAIGEVFESRAGHAAYYRAHVSDLQPSATYHYAVQTNDSISDWHTFRTYDPKAESFSFLYMGDVQDTIAGITNHLLRQAVDSHPEVEFVAFGGDLTERPTDSFWNETFRSIDSVCTAMPVLNITGNHDYLKYIIRKCERRFALTFPYFLKGMSERNDLNHLYSLRYHNTDLYLLDTNRRLLYLYQQRKWLDNEFRESTASHHIVLGHHPLYSVKKKNNNLIQRWLLADIIEEAQADLVLQGHEHAYARCTADEEPLTGSECATLPLYTISHCSPKSYRIRPTRRFSNILSGSRYYQVVTVNRDDMLMRAYDANSGALVDSVRIIGKAQ